MIPSLITIGGYGNRNSDDLKNISHVTQLIPGRTVICTPVGLLPNPHFFLFGVGSPSDPCGFTLRVQRSPEYHEYCEVRPAFELDSTVLPVAQSSYVSLLLQIGPGPPLSIFVGLPSLCRHSTPRNAPTQSTHAQARR